MMNATQKDVLRTLYRLAQADQPADLALLADALGLRCATVDAVLRQLEWAGLVDAERVRLTFVGLTMAVGLVGRQRRPTDRSPRRSSSRAA